VASLGQWVLAGARWEGAGSFQEWRRGLGVERSTVWMGGASGAEGDCWALSPISMASSLSEEVSDSSSSEGGWASGCGGGTPVASLSFEKASWSSPKFGQWGGGDGGADRDGPGGSSLWGGGVWASGGCTSMMKSTVGAGGVLLGASGMRVSELVAVGALGVVVSLRRFLDLGSL